MKNTYLGSWGTAFVLKPWKPSWNSRSISDSALSKIPQSPTIFKPLFTYSIKGKYHNIHLILTPLYQSIWSYTDSAFSNFQKISLRKLHNVLILYFSTWIRGSRYYTFEIKNHRCKNLVTQLASGENFLKYVLHHHLGGCESTFIFLADLDPAFFLRADSTLKPL